MSLPRFQYLPPKTIEEACFLLGTYNGNACLLAGGTDLLVAMKTRLITPEYLIGFRNIVGLRYIRYEQEEGLSIGALTTIHDVACSSLVRQRLTLLAEAAESIGSPQIRSLATIGGNLCRAAPSADTSPPLIALKAKVRLVGLQGKRVMDLQQFFTGLGETARLADELMEEIIVPNVSPRTGGAYVKLKRNSVDIAIVGVAGLVTLDDNGLCSNARIVLGAVGTTPIVVTEAEELLKHRRLEDNLIGEVARLASEVARPISDVRSSADYRRQIVKVLTKRAVVKALERASSA